MLFQTCKTRAGLGQKKSALAFFGPGGPPPLELELFIQLLIGWVINDRIFIFVWTIPLSVQILSGAFVCVEEAYQARQSLDDIISEGMTVNPAVCSEACFFLSPSPLQPERAHQGFSFG